MHWHITLAADGRSALFPSAAARVEAARALATAGGSAGVLFCAADDHVHLVVRAERAGRIASRLSQLLRHRTGGPLEPARLRAVETRAHLESLVRYVLDPSSHHQLATADHPATWPGSCFLDLVSARALPGFRPGTLRESLPRLSREELYAAVGLEPVEPAGDDVLASLGADALAEAAAGTVGLPAPLGQTASEVVATRAVVQLAGRLGVPSSRLALALGASRRTLERCRAAPPVPDAERAIRQWVAVSRAAALGHTRVARSA